MKRLSVYALIVLGLSLASTGNSNAADRKAHIVLEIDVSGSNPIVPLDETAESFQEAKSHAKAMASLVKDRLVGIKLRAGSQVQIRTFGERNPRKQTRSNVIVSTKNRPNSVKASLLKQILGFPDKVKAGVVEPQQATNIAAMLFNLADRVQCQDYDVHVFVITDGMEASEYGRKPPPAKKNIFKGCSRIYFFGLYGRTDAETQSLKEAWRDFATVSGFKDVEMIAAD